MPVLAAGVLAVPVVAADPAQDEMDKVLAKAKKEKKYVSVVFTQFG